MQRTREQLLALLSRRCGSKTITDDPGMKWIRFPADAWELIEEELIRYERPDSV